MENNENLIPEFEDFDEIIVDITEEDFKEKTSVEEEQEKVVEEEPIADPVKEVTEEPVQEVTEEVEEADDQTATALYKTLTAKGIIPEDAEYDGSWEKLDQYFDTLPERIAEDIIGSAPDLTKKIIEFAFVSGDNISKESLKTFMETYLEDIEANSAEIDIESNEGARNFLKQELSKTIKSPVAIEATLDALEDDGSLLNEAKSKYEEFKKQNKHQSIIDNQLQANQQAEERAKQRTLAIQKELSSGQYQPSTVTDIVDYLKSNDINSVLKNAFNKPKAFVQLIHFLTKYNQETGEFDFDTFVTEAASTEVNNIKKNILKDNFSSLPKTTSKKNVNPTKKYEKIEPIIEF